MITSLSKQLSSSEFASREVYRHLAQRKYKFILRRCFRSTGVILLSPLKRQHFLNYCMEVVILQLPESDC